MTPSNPLAHHLRALEGVGLVERRRDEVERRVLALLSELVLPAGTNT